MRLVFMGTPDFAVPSLKALVRAGHDVAGVFTQPDRPRGRGYAVTPPPVKSCALSFGLPVFQPASWKDGEAAEQLRTLRPDAAAVVAYGRLLPRTALDIPPLGCVNLHASLLPKYRGAAPIQWAVARGETETGVTTMHMAPELDAGDMIYSEKTPVGPDDTAGDLHDRLMDMGAALLVKTMADLEVGRAPRIPQDAAEATFAPLLRREDARIDWMRPAAELGAFVRGMCPWPGAWGGSEESPVKIFAARPTGRMTSARPGRVVSAGSDGLEVACGDGYTLLITKIQVKGGRRMAAGAFLRGHAAMDEL